MKLCKDCKHHWSATYDWCNYPDPPIGLPHAKVCQDERRENGSCGADAKHFKPSLRYRLKSWFVPLPLILIIALVVLAGCMERHQNTVKIEKNGFQEIGGHSYHADTTYRIDLIHAEHCQCKGPK